MFKKIFIFILLGFFIYPVSALAISDNAAEGNGIRIGNESELMSNRYYYKWERVNTVKLGEKDVSVKEAFSVYKLNSLISDGFSGIGAAVNDPGIFSYFANKAYSKFSSYNNGIFPGKLIFWRGDEVQYEYDRLDGSKAIVGKRIKLSCVQFANERNNNLVYLQTISHYLNIK